MIKTCKWTEETRLKRRWNKIWICQINCHFLLFSQWNPVIYKIVREVPKRDYHVFIVTLNIWRKCALQSSYEPLSESKFWSQRQERTKWKIMKHFATGSHIPYSTENTVEIFFFIIPKSEGNICNMLHQQVRKTYKD